MPVFDTVNHPLAGTNVIEASAGTGKTFNIQKLVLRLIIEKGLTIDKILAVTFTEAATAEPREKIRSELSAAMYYLDPVSRSKTKIDDVARDILAEINKDENAAKLSHDRLLLAILDFDMASIYTIHGFCSRMLNDCSFESAIPFNTELVTDQTELIAGIIDDFWRKEFYQQPAIIAAAAAYLKINRKKLKELAKDLMKPGIIPDNKTKNGTAGKLESMFQQAIVAWTKDSAEIIEFLNNTPILGRAEKTFRAQNLSEYFQVMDELLTKGRQDE